MFGLKTVTVVIYTQTDAIWGVFSSDKKARKAVARWKGKIEDFLVMEYGVNYRLSTKPVRYASDD